MKETQFNLQDTLHTAHQSLLDSEQAIRADLEEHKFFKLELVSHFGRTNSFYDATQLQVYNFAKKIYDFKSATSGTTKTKDTAAK